LKPSLPRCAPDEQVPRRIQLRRTAGWRKPARAVVVARPSKWGNPFRVEQTGDPEYLPLGAWYVDDGLGVEFFATRREAARYAVEVFESDLLYGDSAPLLASLRAELGGRDLCCWCKPGEPCHADVLLRLAALGGAA
jgi:hypothetical protein